MMHLKRELGRLALIVVATAGGTAGAAPNDQAAANDPAAPAQAQPAQGDESEPIACPAPQGQVATAQPAYQAPPPTAEPSEAYDTGTWVRSVGLALSVGGGVSDFVGDTMRSNTGVGGSWNARLTLGTRSIVAGEVSYIGSAQSISAIGLQNNSELIGNGVQAGLRLNGTVDYPVQPFIFGAAAWRHYSLNTNSPNFSDVRTSSDAFEVPVGIGIAAYYEGFMFDARGEYRFGWVNHDIFPDTGNVTMDRWGAFGNLGYNF